jgi:formylglycine-generating enzyme required for sulfatase activity
MKVFVSYNHEDSQVAVRVVAFLRKHNIEVTIDSAAMPPGGDIQGFIERSIRDTDVTLSIVSNKSLASGWVALESVTTFWFEKFERNKRFIPCYLDKDLFEDDYSNRVLPQINERLAQLDAQIEADKEKGGDPQHLQSQRTRLFELKKNLGKILLRLRDSLTLDIREEAFEPSLTRIVELLGQSPDSSDIRFEAAFNDRIRKDSRQLDKRFVQLTMLIDKGEQEHQRIQREKLDSIDDLLRVVDRDKALVLLGDPGSGKSTLLRRFEVDYYRDQTRTRGRGLSFFVPLNRYKPGSLDNPTEPQAFLESMWQKYYDDTSLSLAKLLKEGRMLLLLDAVNEMPHSDQDQYHQLLDVWRQFTVDQVERGNRILFSCRSLDYSLPLSTPDLRVHNVELQPLTAEKTAEFLRAYLPQRHDDVLATIRRNETLDFYSNPYFLSLLCEQVGTSGEVPKGRASLFTSYVRQAMKREVESGRLVKLKLLTIDDQKKLAGNYWATPFKLPDQGPLPHKLSHLAYEMQQTRKLSEKAGGQQNKQVSIQKGRAIDLIAIEQSEAIISAALAMNVLDEDLATNELTYYHQLLQEYFAGRRLATEPKPELVRVEWRASEVRPSLAETIAGLANGDPLPPPGQTGWEETTLAALPMSGDPEGYVARLMEQNLPLAARCAVSPEVEVSEELKDRIREGLIARTQDMTADLRARIAAGEALGLIGDPRFKRYRGGEGECLLPPLVEIPAGRYLIGDDQSSYADEKPAHKVELAAYRIGAFPVTNGEYAQFIAAGGYEDERWWDTPAALSWLREGGADGQKQSYRDARLNFQRNWTDEQIRAMIPQNQATERQVELYLWMRNSSDEEFERQLDTQVPAGTLYRYPGFWEDATYNNPAQPVVGVCWYEARAYCNWLSFVTGEGYRLPTEVEFEAAARGRKGRAFPYGDKFDSALCNTFESHIRRTTPVGVFANVTPEGAYDLSGNAYTWTSTIFDQDKFPYPWQPDQREESGDAEARRLVRGGSWVSYQGSARAAYRGNVRPADRGNDLGFRVVCGLRPPSLKH